MNVLSSVTVNVGGASPARSAAERSRKMQAWAQAALSERPPDLVVAQEVTDGWLRMWSDAQYDVFTVPSTWRTRSALLVRQNALISAESIALSTQDYHGSYLAAARLEVEGWDGVAVSVHASPSEVTEEWLETWPGSPPDHRHGGGARPERLWDSDLVLETLVRTASDVTTLVAAGDLNECLAWDEDHEGETWGRDFFQRVTEVGLTSALHAAWGTERATHFTSGQPEYQLDHILTGGPVTIVDASIDEAWSDAQQVEAEQLSDHAPIWFSIELQ